MKKALLITISILVIICFFAACKSNGSGDNMTTVAVTDKSGETHYYSQVTGSDKKPVTDGKGKPVTTEITASGSKKAPSNKASTDKADGSADNTVKFEATTKSADSTAVGTTKGTTAVTSAAQGTTNQPASTTEKQTKPATDKDGWVDKWY
mgnify:FL=1